MLAILSSNSRTSFISTSALSCRSTWYHQRMVKNNKFIPWARTVKQNSKLMISKNLKLSLWKEKFYIIFCNNKKYLHLPLFAPYESNIFKSILRMTWCKMAITREKGWKNTAVSRDASVKRHDAVTRRNKYDSCPALMFQVCLIRPKVYSCVHHVSVIGLKRREMC